MFITIVDDFSRFTWIYMIKQKSDFIEYFILFHAYVKTQFGKTIQVVRSDNALDLTEGEIIKFYKKEGITHQTSCSTKKWSSGKRT